MSAFTAAIFAWIIRHLQLGISDFLRKGNLLIINHLLVSFERILMVKISRFSNWQGSNIFRQIDCSGKIRTEKIMLFNSVHRKRIKDPFNHIQCMHKYEKL